MLFQFASTKKIKRQKKYGKDKYIRSSEGYQKRRIQSGAKICLSTDAPANSWAVPTDPFTNLKAAVTRIAYDGTDTGQSERLDIETAVKLYTREAAKICGFAGSGELSPGCSADFIVLSDDIFTSDPDDIDKIQVEETYIEGEKVFSRC